MDWLLSPWPWYVAGPLIGLTVPALLLLVGKPFGISSSFRHLSAICSPRTDIDYLKSYDWRGEVWNLLFVVGILIGGAVAAGLLSADPVPFLPGDYQSWTGALKLLVGGLLVGFGTRYADGCTSGHTIMGLSSLNWPSLVASICFFAGGLFVVWFLPLALS
ncbi:MAG: YeeE/YedE family protein [Gemmatimonadetes bacterium]|jgi:uncharacterized protein|nr:YeeE/YedE family protein [Gemmatimonadota bacterium]